MLLVLGPPSALIFSWTPIGRALTRRLKGQGEDHSESLEEIHRLLEDMHDSIDRVAVDMDDLRDRISFAERLLAAGIEKDDRVAGKREMVVELEGVADREGIADRIRVADRGRVATPV